MDTSRINALSLQETLDEEKQADDTKHSHAQIPRAHSHPEWQRREHDNCEDEQQSSDGDQTKSLDHLEEPKTPDETLQE